MKKTFLLSLGLLLCLAGSAFAGGNAGAQAYISWSNTNNTTLDTCPATNPGTLTLFLRLDRPGVGLQFKGGEFDMSWCPAGDGAGCYDYLNTFKNTSAGTTCTYLNRGGPAAPPDIVDPDHIHVAWANNSCSPANCTAGTIARIQWDTSTCPAWPTPATFTLNSLKVVDCQSIEDVLVVAGGRATVCGGCPLPVTPSTWGKIKSLYKN